MPLPPHSPVGLCGLWLEREHDDVILHRPTNNPWFKMHVLSHEVAHILLDHGANNVGDGSTSLTFSNLMTTFDQGMQQELESSTIRSARGASSYDRREEYDAELLATIILGQNRRMTKLGVRDEILKMV